MATLDDLLAEFSPPLPTCRGSDSSVSNEHSFLEELAELFNQQGQELLGVETSSSHFGSFAFRWLYSLQFNAVAASKDKFRFIGINLGTVTAIYDLFNTLLSHPRLMPGIGNPEVEDPSAASLELGLSARRLQEEFLSAGATVQSSSIIVPRMVPRDPTRAWYARLLSGLALDFVYYHELTHLLAGHTTYRRSQLGLAERVFAVEDPGHLPSDVVATARALELDADMFAARLLVVPIIDGKGLVAERAGIPPAREALHAAALALVFFFSLAGRAARQWSSRDNSPHPHPFERALLLMPEIRRVLSEGGLEGESDWETGYRSALLELKRACEVTGFGAEFYEQVPGEGHGMLATLERSFAEHSRVLSELRGLGFDMRMN